MIKAIGAGAPLSKPTKAVTNEVKKRVGQINSYEFQLGFIPKHAPGKNTVDQTKVEHFIDQII